MVFCCRMVMYYRIGKTWGARKKVPVPMNFFKKDYDFPNYSNCFPDPKHVMFVSFIVYFDPPSWIVNNHCLIYITNYLNYYFPCFKILFDLWQNLYFLQ